MRTWLFSKTARYFAKPMTAEENESASRLVKVERRRLTDIDKSGKALRLKVFFIQYTLWLNSFNEHKMDVIKMDLLTRNKRKICLLMGIS
jgi:hypothetical protein